MNELKLEKATVTMSISFEKGDYVQVWQQVMPGGVPVNVIRDKDGQDPQVSFDIDYRDNEEGFKKVVINAIALAGISFFPDDPKYEALITTVNTLFPKDT